MQPSLEHQEEAETLRLSTPVPPSLPIEPVSGDLLPSSHHAALMMQSFAAEQASRDDVNVAHFNQLRGIMVNIASAVNASAQSAAASSTRLDGAMAKVVASNTDVTAAVASIKAGAPNVYAPTRRPSKRSKTMARGSALQPVDLGSGVGREDTSGDGDGGGARDCGGSTAGDGDRGAAATKNLSSSASPTFYHDIVHNIAIPVEMVTDTLKSEPLFNQLSSLLKLCHVSAGHPGLFGSLVVNGLYQDGVKHTNELRRQGGATGTINVAKTVRMTNIVKNKVLLYLRQVYWMHSVVPNLLKLPQAASFDNMQSCMVGPDEQKVLTVALRQVADEYALAPSDPLRDPIQATSSLLREQLKKMSGRPGTPGPMNAILSSSPFRELLAEAEKNIKARYK